MPESPPSQTPAPSPDHESTPGSFVHGEPEAGRWNRWFLVLVPLLLVVVVLDLVRIPYFVLSPGPAEDVLPLIHISGRTVYEPKGHLLLTSVYESRGRVTIYQALRAWIDPSQVVVPEREILYPGQTTQQAVQVAQSQMDESKFSAALLVVGRYAGYPKTHAPGAFIVSVLAGTPAAGRLLAQDVITEVDGKVVADPDALGRLIQQGGPGTALDLTVLRGGRTRRVAVTPAIPKGGNHLQIGVETVDNFPFRLSIDSEDIGGPSAGLMWAVGLVDLLTPGDLTGGRTIAGTGQIEPNGRVLPIGGVEEKVVAAERAGATIFFVPVDNAAAARSVAHHITIVPVKTYQDAVTYLQRNP